VIGDLRLLGPRVERRRQTGVKDCNNLLQHAQGTNWPDWLPLALAFKKVWLGHDNDEPNADGERPGDRAAASLVPALRSYGAEPQRYPPLSKDWNQDLQELGFEQLRGLVTGESAVAPAPSEAAGRGAQPEVALHLAPETPVVEPMPEAAYPGPEAVEEPDRAEVVELLGWLKTADLPHERFQLRPGLNVVDVGRFVATLQAELSAEIIGPRWRAAAQDLKQLHEPAEVPRLADTRDHRGWSVRHR
jgi:hypothetical protein